MAIALTCQHCGFRHASRVAYCARCERPLISSTPLKKPTSKQPIPIKTTARSLSSMQTVVTANDSPVSRLLAKGASPRTASSPNDAAPPMATPIDHSLELEKTTVTLKATPSQRIVFDPNTTITPQPAVLLDKTSVGAPIPTPHLQPEAPQPSQQPVRDVYRRLSTQRAQQTAVIHPANWGSWRLVLAMLIDGLVLIGLGSLWFVLFPVVLSDSQKTKSTILLDYLSVWLVHHSLHAQASLVALSGLCFVYSLAGALWQTTPGRYCMRLRLTRLDGENVGFSRALLRTCLVMGLGFPCAGLTFWWILLSAQRRGLHDVLCRCRVQMQA